MRVRPTGGAAGFLALLLACALCSFPGPASGQRSASPVASETKPEQRPKLIVQLGHADRIESAAISPDNKFALTGGGDQIAILWDMTTGREIRRFPAHPAPVSSVAFSPDGRLVLTASSRMTRLLDATTGAELKILTGFSGDISSASFSPDGRQALTAISDDTTLLWDAETGNQILRFKGSRGAFLAGGSLIWTTSEDGVMRFYNPVSGQEIRTVKLANKKLTAVSPDGGVLLVSNSRNSDMKLLDAQTGKEIPSPGGEAEGFPRSHEVAVSPDGKFVALLAGPGFDFNNSANLRTSFWLYDMETGKSVRRILGSADFSGFNTLSSDGRFLLTARPPMNQAAGSNQTLLPPLPPKGPGSATIYDITTGQEVRLAGVTSPVSDAMFSPDGRYVLTGVGDGSAQLWDLENGRQARRLQGPSGKVNSVAFSRDGRFLLIGSDEKSAALFDASTGDELERFNADSGIRSVSFSSQGRAIAVTESGCFWDVRTGRKILETGDYGVGAITPDGRFGVTTGGPGEHDAATLWDALRGKQIRHFKGNGNLKSISFAPTGRYILTAGGFHYMAASLWDISTGREVRRFVGHAGSVTSAALSPDGKLVLTGSDDHTAILWDVDTAQEIRRLQEDLGAVSSVEFSPDARLAVIGSEDGTTRLWELKSGKELCRLISLRDGNWVVADREGRFDTSSIEDLRGVYWTAPDDPEKPIPLDTFISGYFEPGLLSRVLGGNDLGPVRSIADLDRARPTVEITGVDPQEDPDLVTVTVQVSKAFRLNRAAGKNGRETSVHDLRLFRDGHLVAQAPVSDPYDHVRNPGEEEQDLATWRSQTNIPLDQTGKRTLKFTNVRLPRVANKKQVVFSAYAFNEDRIKTETDRLAFAIPPELTPLKARAYLITMGVNAYENPGFNLNFAANDSRAIQKALSEELSKTDEYSEIVQVPLVSDYERRGAQTAVTSKLATKGYFRAVLNLLAGKEVDPEIAKSIPNASRIGPARPEDLVLISISSHGYADPRGNFYLVPYDTGEASGITQDFLDRCLSRAAARTARPAEYGKALAFLSRCISSDELSDWLRDVDAGEMVMIIDACHSGAAVKGTSFKPGPMGSKGLGQLSYDKGMRILAATQADNVALEKNQLKQGLLTYALIEDGLRSGQADFDPTDGKITLREWLSYGVERVPKLYGDVQKSGQAQKLLVLRGTATSKVQQPSLFDFARSGSDAVLVPIVPGNHPRLPKVSGKPSPPPDQPDSESTSALPENGARTAEPGQDFSGEWITDDGRPLMIRQFDKSAGGVFVGGMAYFGGGVIGNILDAEWYLDNEPAGNVRFVFSKDGRSFEALPTDKKPGRVVKTLPAKITGHRWRSYKRLRDLYHEVDGVAVMIPFRSDGLKYTTVAAGEQGGFEALDYDESGFNTSSAPFGQPKSTCKYLEVKTACPDDNDILLRKRFELPEGGHNLEVHLVAESMDDPGQVQVFFNGLDISGGLRSGWFTGCDKYLLSLPPTDAITALDENHYAFEVPNIILRPGSNLLAVRARAGYLDFQVKGQLNAYGVEAGFDPKYIMSTFTFPSDGERGPWMPTAWASLKYRLLCSSRAGSGKWLVQLRNDDEREVSADLLLEGRGPTLSIPPRSKGEFAQAADLPCDKIVNLTIGPVRFRP